MQFSSAVFIAFVSVALLFYYLLPKKCQWWILLLSSYVFYSFAGAKYLIFILYTTAVAYLTGLLLQRKSDAEEAFVEATRDVMEKSERKAYRAKQKKIRLRILTAGLLLGFGLLAVLKYTAFAVGTVSDLLTAFGGESIPIPSLLLPLGLSFYTFQSMGYLIDLYRKKIRAEKNFFKFALFVSYFPGIVQGPISRFGDLGEQLTAKHRFDGNSFATGLCRAVWGYFKKIVVADTAMIGVRFLNENTATHKGIYVFLLILLYSAEIYGDFTGGIDITIGISGMFGIRLAENFNRPFSSKTIKEYWRRWHITMGSWFTDYIFYPLSVSPSMQKLSVWSRKRLGNAIGKRVPVYFATIVTWFLTGLWHGAGWNFIVWGLLNCFAMLISQELSPLWNLFAKKNPGLVASKGWAAFQMIRTFLIMGLFRSLDVYRDVPLTFRLWGSMIASPNFSALTSGSFLTSFGMSVPNLIVLGFGILILFLESRFGKTQPLYERLPKKPVLCTATLSVFVFLILLFGSYGIGFDSADFIYGQF